MSIKYKTVFSKTGDMRYVSHLDLVRLFQRASRRADLPITVTQGYSPHLKISISRALKLGMESVSEEAVFYMDREIGAKDFVHAINEKLPEGVRVTQAEIVEKGGLNANGR